MQVIYYHKDINKLILTKCMEQIIQKKRWENWNGWKVTEIQLELD